METRHHRLQQLVRTGFALALGLSLAAVGCTPTQESDSEWRIGDTGTDTGPEGDGWSGDGSDDAGGPNEPLSTTFRLENNSAGEVYVTPVGPCTADSDPWVTLSRDGDSIDPRDSCGTCNCEDLQDGTCAVCGAPACAPSPRRRTLEAGDSVEWTWRGRIYRSDTVDGRSCERAVVPERGEMFQAEICYEDPTAFRPICETVEFPYGKDEVVRRVDPGGGEPQPTEFELTNRTDSTLTIRTAKSCQPNRYPWVGLRDGGDRVDFSTNCAFCSCSEAESGDCAVCDLACPELPDPELEPGESKTLQWDGVGHRRDRAGGRQCHRRWVPPAGRELDARFCWSNPTTSDRTANCETVSFEYGRDETVEKVVGSEDREPTETSFTIQNNSHKPIEVDLVQTCHADSPEWLDLIYDGEEVDPGVNCEECDCEDLRRHGECSRACPAASCVGGTMSLSPGDKQTWTWPGYVAQEGSVDGKQCLEEVVPPAGRNFDAEFCWTAQTPSGPTERCTTETFTYGQQTEITHTVP